MGMLERIAATLGYTKATVNNAPAWLQATAEAEQFTIPERTLPEAQAELYQRLSWVQIAVSTVARVAATTKFSVVEMSGDDAEQVVDHEFEKLLRRPNPLNSRAEFLEATFSFKALTGNAYWWLNRASANDKPQELWLLPSHKVKPIPDRRLYIRGYEYTPDGAETAMVLEPWEICHFRTFHPLNSFVGLSPIEALATVATGDMAMQKWNTNYFGKDNAKLPGALAFADPVDDVAWAKIKKDTEEKHGGTKRRLMMLRNVGKGGVEWLPMAMSQTDMQFLEGRSFNKEEIYSIYAPGLASLLAVNATEANSVSGKKTFIEFSVWPQLVQVAEKISNDILPIYGEQYNGEFEDIRITDRSMDLAEQSAFAQVHTIDEIRERFHKAKPLGDDRGKLLPAEIGKGMTDSRAPEDKPEPVQAPPFGQQQSQQEQPQDVAPPDNVDTPEDAPEVDTVAKAKEAKALRKWIKRRPHADVAEFDAEHLSDDEIKAIANEMRPEGAADTDFFTKAIHSDGDDRKRKQLELYHADKIERALRKWQRLIVPSGTTTENITPDLAVERMRDNQKILRDAIIEMLMDGAHLGAETGISQAEALLGVGKAVSITGVDWEMVNDNVLQWVLGSGGGFGDGYGDELMTLLIGSSERAIRREIGEWVNNGLPYSTLLDNLQRSVFSRQRSIVLAETEITRAFFEGNVRAWSASGVISQIRFNALNDEISCNRCGPMNQQVVNIGQPFVHPDGTEYRSLGIHPRCRCFVTPVADSVN